MLAEAHPAALEGDTLTLEFPPEARLPPRAGRGAAERVAALQDALYEVTGRRLELAFATGAPVKREKREPDRPATEEEIVELMKTTFDAQRAEVVEPPARPAAPHRLNAASGDTSRAVSDTVSKTETLVPEPGQRGVGHLAHNAPCSALRSRTSSRS